MACLLSVHLTRWIVYPQYDCVIFCTNAQRYPHFTNQPQYAFLSMASHRNKRPGKLSFLSILARASIHRLSNSPQNYAK